MVHGIVKGLTFSAGLNYKMLMNSRDDIAKRLRLLPAALDISIGELAAAAGASPSAWSNYISATSSQNVIPWECALALWKAFGIPMPWIYAGHWAGGGRKLRARLKSIRRSRARKNGGVRGRGRPPVGRIG